MYINYQPHQSPQTKISNAYVCAIFVYIFFLSKHDEKFVTTGPKLKSLASKYLSLYSFQYYLDSMTHILTLHMKT